MNTDRTNGARTLPALVIVCSGDDFERVEVEYTGSGETRTTTQPETPEGYEIGAKVTFDNGEQNGRIHAIERIERTDARGITITEIIVIRTRNGSEWRRSKERVMPLHESDPQRAWEDVVLLLLRCMLQEGITDDKQLRHRAYTQLGRQHDKDHAVTKSHVQAIIDSVRRSLDAAGLQAGAERAPVGV